LPHKNPCSSEKPIHATGKFVGLLAWIIKESTRNYRANNMLWPQLGNGCIDCFFEVSAL